jgi:signal transduction histidine kinase
MNNPVKTHIKVLLIEDNPGDVRLIWEILSEVRNSPFYLDVADSLLNGLNAIEKNRSDVILLDLSLGDSNGIYTLNRVRDKAPDIPIVILTGMDDEVTAIKALKEGAQDYLVKGRTDSDLLKRALVYAIERNRLVHELEEKKATLEEQDAVRRNFTLMLFHELLIPATSIKSAMLLIEKANEHAGAEDRNMYADVVKNNIQRLFALLDDLIDVSEIEAGNFTVKKETCDIGELIARNVMDIKAFTDEKKLEIKEEVNNDKIEASVDKYRVSQAITNLIINSVKSSVENSAIIITAKKTNGVPANAPDYVRKQYTADMESICIGVKDSGSGFSKKTGKEVFDQLFSTNAAPDKRIGLGLLITKNIVSTHGGIMWAESEGENKGASFYMLLPAK